jgi:hypothetical protein
VFETGSNDHRIVVDGEWLTDPITSEAVLNPRGVVNSSGPSET